MRRSKSSHKQPAEHRAPDQDAALERTFTDGTALDVLPPKDRRPQTKPVESVTATSPDGSLVTFAAPAALPVVDNSKPTVPSVDPRAKPIA